MIEPYNLFERVLSDIEAGLKENINTDILAGEYSLSATHLRRLFQFAFNRSIGTYIRSRKLASSINDLLNTNLNVLDVALLYGFEYEQSYIRSFKREFGLTPGDLRKTGQIIKINPPLHLFDCNRLEDGAFFGPDIVMVPQFHVIGRKNELPFKDYLSKPILFTHDFYNNYREKITDIVDESVHINININAQKIFKNTDTGYSFFMPSVQVKTMKNIPENCESYTFPSTLCARYNFIGPTDTVINMAVADRMFMAIDKFMNDEHQKYFLERNRLNIDRFYKFDRDGYYLWEWFAPVIIKNKVDTPGYSAGITETYRQELPPLRFMGKKFIEPLNDNLFKNINTNLDKLRSNSQLDEIEKLAITGIKTLYDGNNAYICLVRKNSDNLLEYLIGIFMPQNSAVPEGYEILDFPKSALAVCRVYGKKDLIINQEKECRKKLEDANLLNSNAAGRDNPQNLFFQRFNWNSFFGEDKFGNRVLEYCFFVN